MELKVSIIDNGNKIIPIGRDKEGRLSDFLVKWNDAKRNQNSIIIAWEEKDIFEGYYILEKGKSSKESASLVEFFSTANRSTGFHEFAHHILRFISDAAFENESSGKPDSVLQSDFNTILRNAGVTRAKSFKTKTTQGNRHRNL